MSGTRQVFFTHDMDRTLLSMRGKRPVTEIADRIGVSVWLLYRRMRELDQPVQPRRQWKRRAA